eukprot:jgi/Bigna1/31824/gw1.31.190.1
MRAILFDWMFQVCAEFENHMDTTFLAVSLVDQVLNKFSIPKMKLQLVGITGILVASKLLETQFPDLNELLFLCDDLYTHDELLKMEMDLLSKLNFSPKRVTVYTYLH